MYLVRIRTVLLFPTRLYLFHLTLLVPGFPAGSVETVAGRLSQAFALFSVGPLGGNTIAQPLQPRAKKAQMAQSGCS